MSLRRWLLASSFVVILILGTGATFVVFFTDGSALVLAVALVAVGLSGAALLNLHVPEDVAHAGRMKASGFLLLLPLLLVAVFHDLI
jgi:hypothetical protein